MTSQQADSEDILQVQDDLFDKNLFAYCDNNPIMREDHGGERWSWKTFFAGVAVVTAVVAVAAFTVASVSYTHLDVYKRQGQKRSST